MNAGSGKSANMYKCNTKNNKNFKTLKMQVQLGQHYLQVHGVENTYAWRNESGANVAGGEASQQQFGWH